MIHEDERRILEDWPEAKIITAKKDCVLGNHYHKMKTEKFILISGIINYKLNNEPKTELEWGQVLTVDPGVKHMFEMRAGSSMIGICSHPYNPIDDYK